MKYQKITVIYLFAVILFFLDRFFKIFTLKGFFNCPLQLINDWLTLSFFANKYIAFSIPLPYIFLLIIISVIIIILIFFWVYLLKTKHNTEAAILSFIILGGISNFWDRINYGYVIDYLDLKYFTVFNIADFMIIIGVILFFLFQFGIFKKYI